VGTGKVRSVMTSGPPGASIAMPFIFVGRDSAELTAAQNPSAATATLIVRDLIRRSLLLAPDAAARPSNQAFT